MRITPVQADVNVGGNYPGQGIPAAAFQSGYAQAGIEIARGAEDIGRILERKTANDAQAEGLLMQSQAELALQETTTKRKAVEMDGPAYYAGFQKDYQDVVQQISSTAKNPGALRVFQTHMARSRVTLNGQALAHADGLTKNAEVAQMITTIGNFDEQIAKLDPHDQNYEQLVIDINAKKDAAIMLAAPRIGLDDATKMIQANRKTSLAFVHKRGETLEEADARRRFEDPGVRPQVIKDLYLGNVYKYMPQDKQIELKDQLVKAENERVEKLRTITEREKTERTDAAGRDIVDFTRAKNFTAANGRLENISSELSAQQKQHWVDYIDSHAKAKNKTDPATHLALSPDVYTANTVAAIGAARMKVIRAAGAGLLDAPDQDKFLSHLQAMEKSLTTAGEDKALTAYRAEHAFVQERLKEDLKVSGPLQSLVPGAQATYSMALNDLARVAPITGPGQERPEAWYTRTKATWISHIKSAATAQVLELEKGVSDAIIQREIAVSGGTPTTATLDKIRRLKDAEAIRQSYQALEGKPMTTKGSSELREEQPSTPLPSGLIPTPQPTVDPRAAAPRSLQAPVGGKKYGME